MTYQGKCHCGAVRFEVKSDLSNVIRCNCSHCAIKGLVLTFVPAAQFTWLAGENELSEYRFNQKAIAHRFCRICGVQPVGQAKDTAGQDTMAINVLCLAGVDLGTLSVTPVNGKDF